MQSIKPRSIELSLLKACPVRCVYCPQPLLRSKTAPDTPQRLSAADLASILRNAAYRHPPGLNVCFAGFTEPMLHPNFLGLMSDCNDHPAVNEIALFTTGEGMTEERIHVMRKFQKLRKDIVLNVNYEAALDPEGSVWSEIQPGSKGTIWKLRKKLMECFPDAQWRFTRRPPREVRRAITKQLRPSHVIWARERSRSHNLLRQSGESSSITHDGPVRCRKTRSRRMPVVIPGGLAVACCQDYGLTLPVGNLVENTWRKLVYKAVLQKQSTPAEDSICHTDCHYARLR